MGETLKNKDVPYVIILTAGLAIVFNIIAAIFAGSILSILGAASVCCAVGWLIYYCFCISKEMRVSEKTLTAGFEQRQEQNSKTQNEIQELRLANQLSQRQKKSIEAIIHSISDAVIVTDEYDNIALANLSASELF